jgi:hypothetical protein
VEHDLFRNPLHTPHQVRGRLFRDHALAERVLRRLDWRDKGPDWRDTNFSRRDVEPKRQVDATNAVELQRAQRDRGAGK